MAGVQSERSCLEGHLHQISPETVGDRLALGRALKLKEYQITAIEEENTHKPGEAAYKILYTWWRSTTSEECTFNTLKKALMDCHLMDLYDQVDIMHKAFLGQIVAPLAAAPPAAVPGLSAVSQTSAAVKMSEGKFMKSKILKIRNIILDATTDWKTLAVVLKLRPREINAIDVKHGSNLNAAISEMLEKWSQSFPQTYNFRFLLDALQEGDCAGAAIEIQELYDEYNAL